MFISVIGILMNDSGYHITGSLPPVHTDQRISASACPPTSPGYPIQRIQETDGSSFANETSTGSRRLTRSKSSVSSVRFRPATTTTMSESLAILTASSNPSIFSQGISMQPAANTVLGT